MLETPKDAAAQVPPKKVKKPKGPIRWEALIPSLVICAAIGAYFILFFDTHVRMALETAGTKALGAEVNVGSLKTSFTRAELTLTGLQITNAETPEKNAVEFGRLHFKMSWDALLRMKFVVEDASIENLQVGTPRKRPGFVLKEEEEAKDAAGAEAEEKKGSALEDAAKLLGGADPMKDIKDIGELKTQAKIKDLQNQLNQKNEQWKSTLSTLSSAGEIGALQSKITGLKIGGTNDPIALKGQIEEASRVLNETNQKINDVRTKGQNLSGDISGFSVSLKGIDDTIKQDKEELQAKLKLPKLDVESLSTQLFGPGFAQKIRQAKKYAAMAMKYMPPKKDRAAAEIIKPHERAKGVNVRFAITTGYPVFWLKRAALSSKAEGSPFGGNLAGQILDVTSDPHVIHRPTLITVKGDFPEPQIQKFDLSATLDHTGDVPSDMVKIGIGSFPVGEKIFANSESVKLGFTQASGSSLTTVHYRGGSLSIESKNIFDKVAYVAESNSVQLKEILQTAVSEVPKIAVDVRGTGTLENLQFSAESNLGEALQKSFDRQLKAKLAEAQKKLQEMIDARVNEEKKKLTDQFEALKSQYTGEINAKQKEVEKLKGQAQAKVDEAKNQAAKQIIPGGGQAPSADDIKKKLGF